MPYIKPFIMVSILYASCVTLSIDSNPTGINSIKADMSSSKAYTLQGTVAQSGYKGIVIRNGKKILGGF
jgi:hypothetical protein